MLHRRGAGARRYTWRISWCWRQPGARFNHQAAFNSRRKDYFMSSVGHHHLGAPRERGTGWKKYGTPWINDGQEALMLLLFTGGHLQYVQCWPFDADSHLFNIMWKERSAGKLISSSSLAHGLLFSSYPICWSGLVDVSCSHLLIFLLMQLMQERNSHLVDYSFFSWWCITGRGAAVNKTYKCSVICSFWAGCAIALATNILLLRQSLLLVHLSDHLRAIAAHRSLWCSCRPSKNIARWYLILGLMLIWRLEIEGDEKGTMNSWMAARATIPVELHGTRRCRWWCSQLNAHNGLSIFVLGSAGLQHLGRSSKPFIRVNNVGACIAATCCAVVPDVHGSSCWLAWCGGKFSLIGTVIWWIWCQSRRHRASGRHRFFFLVRAYFLLIVVHLIRKDKKKCARAHQPGLLITEVQSHRAAPLVGVTGTFNRFLLFIFIIYTFLFLVGIYHLNHSLSFCCCTVIRFDISLYIKTI